MLKAKQQQIAIIGLGRVGGQFLQALLAHGGKSCNIVCVSEVAETKGLQQAKAANINVLDIEKVISKGKDIDIIFDLSGNKALRRSMREMLQQTENKHTVIASESVAYLMWSLLTDEALPNVHAHQGY
ncbi:MAG: hypothetical protein R8L53_04495 [Mariprofundales bacterium]